MNLEIMVALAFVIKKIESLERTILNKVMTTEAELEAYINQSVVPAWQAIGALGAQFQTELTNLEGEIASLQAQLAAAGQPVDETPALTALQNLVAQMTAATQQGSQELSQLVAPIAAANAASSTVPGAPAPASANVTAVSGGPATVSVVPAVAPFQPASALGASDTPPSPANK